MRRIKTLFSGTALAVLLAGGEDLRAQSNSTVLLFNYVTNQASLDSRVVISNTPLDPSGATSVAGACSLNYYSNTSADTGRSPQRSTAIQPGTQLVFSLSGGGTNGIAATPGFQGYIIATCDFPNGQGTVAITDSGASKYLSMVPAIILGGSGVTLERTSTDTTTPNSGLLFNFVTNQANFDTRLVISNTSKDPLGTNPKSGACTLYYYGATSGGQASKTQRSGTVLPGTQLDTMISTGGTHGIGATPSFRGSVIASCDFPYAQGTASITDAGGSKYLSVVPAIPLNRTPPVANAGANQNVTVGATVQLDGGASTSFDNSPLSYQWSLTARPTGSTAAISSPSSKSPTFIADVAGIFVAQLIVNDGFAVSPPSTAVITAGVPSAATISFSQPSVTITGTVTQNLTLNLSAAQGGPVTINVSSSIPAILSVPATVVFPANSTSVSVPVTSIAPGTAVVHASSLPNIADTSITVTVNPRAAMTVSFALPSVSIVTGTTQSLTLNLSAPAPSFGLLINLTSDNPAVASVQSNISFPPNSNSVTIPVVGGTPGSTVIHANSLPTVPDATVNITVTKQIPLTLSFSPANLTIAGTATQNLTLNLSTPAPTALTIDLSSSNPNAAKVPATVNVTQNATSVLVPVTGVATGAAVIHASALPNIPDTTANVNVVPPGSLPAITVTSVSVGQNLEASVTINLAQPAPAGGLQLTLATTDSTKVLVAGRQADAGTTSLVVPVAEGVSRVGGLYAQGLVSSGTVNITASAANYSTGTGTITLTPSGFLLAGPGGATTFSTAIAGNALLTVTSARLNPSLGFAENQQVRGGFSTSVPVTSSSTDVGTITFSPVTFSGGDSSAVTQFKAVAVGSSTLTAAVPAGFSAPSAGNSVTVSVTPAGLTPANVTVGKNLENSAQVIINGTAPAGGLQLTLTSNNPSQMLLSNTPTAAGSATITLNVPAGFSVSPVFYVYGLASSGTPTYSVSAPGFGTGTGTVTLGPSGFVISGPFGLGAPSFLTTTGAPNVNITVYSVLLDASSAVVTQQAIAGGVSVNVNVTSSNTAVGSITTSPVNFTGGANTASTQFAPKGPGSTVLVVNAPSGYATPTQYTSVTGNVSTAGMAVIDGETIGQNLQLEGALLLGQVAPAGGLVVTITSNNPAQLLLSNSATAPGSASITLNIPAGGFSASYYVHALGSTGTVSHTASAPGYLSRTGTITLAPSGVVIGGPFGFGFPFPFPTSVGTTTSLNVYSALLDPGNNRYVSIQSLRAGLTLRVNLTTSNPGAGSISSPVTINGGTDHAVAQFTAGPGTGQTTISVVAPTSVVTGPAANNTTVGANVQ